MREPTNCKTNGSSMGQSMGLGCGMLDSNEVERTQSWTNSGAPWHLWCPCQTLGGYVRCLKMCACCAQTRNSGSSTPSTTSLRERLALSCQP
eukprot:6455637-Amphidinium_carterae.2